MRNERGITLIELVAVLAIVGIILTLISSVLISGLKASDRSSTNQRLQQEANYITEAIRNEYLNHPDKVENPIITLKVEDNKLKLDETTISEGYTYTFGSVDSIDPSLILEIDRNEESVEYKLKLEKNNQIYEVNTTLSKLK